MTLLQDLWEKMRKGMAFETTFSFELMTELVKRERAQLVAHAELTQAAQRFLPLLDAVEESYDDSVIIRCEVTAGDLRQLRAALGKVGVKDA